MTADSRPLAGKVALVTGGSRGIGRATVLELASQGADVVINYFRHAAEGQATADAARAHGVRAIAVRAHMGKAEDVEALVATAVRDLGGLDILVCNAASGVFRPLLEVDDQAWDWTMNVSVRSALRCVQQAAPLLAARGGGRIVTIGSAWTLRARPLYGMVGTAKGALDMLTRALAVELAHQGTVVNAVAPGAIATDAWNVYQAAVGDDLTAETVRQTPTGALVTPEQVARVVAFLCTAEGIVGQTIVVDNGHSVAG